MDEKAKFISENLETNGDKINFKTENNDAKPYFHVGHSPKRDDQLSNPWLVENINDFLYFCCPECNEKNRDRELFLKHAFDEHPMAKQGLGMISNKMSIMTIFGHKHFKQKLDI